MVSMQNRQTMTVVFRLPIENHYREDILFPAKHEYNVIGVIKTWKAVEGGRMKFELNDYRKELTDEEILQDIRNVARLLNSNYVSLSKYKKRGKHSQTAIQRHFGTWKNALAVAGLRSEKNADELKRITDEEIFEDLRRVARHIQCDTVSYAAYIMHGKYSHHNIFKRFGKWNIALQKAGLNGTGFSKDIITEQQCFDEIERIWIQLGRQPTTTDIINKGVSKYSIDTFKRRFGGWRRALEAFVNYINDVDTGKAEVLGKDKNDNNQEKDASECSFSNDGTSEEQDDNSLPVILPRHRTSRNINAKLRFIVLQRDHFKCCACGASPAKDPAVLLHVDHIVPWSKGGETVLENLQTLCAKCNLGKSDIL